MKIDKQNEKITLNDYTRKKNKEGLKEVSEMLKHPMTIEQTKEQTRSFLREKKMP